MTLRYESYVEVAGKDVSGSNLVSRLYMIILLLEKE